MFLVMPIVGLGFFAVLPFEQALPAYVLVNVPLVLFYRPVHRALHEPAHCGLEAMLGAEGKVVEVRPGGRMMNCLVRCQGETWSAFALRPVSPDSRVTIVRFEGTRPVVEISGLVPPVSCRPTSP
ncbi:MAG: NfeD family protein [Chloroflexota bacterium]